MATTSEMIAAGVADFGGTLILIYMAFLGSKIFTPLLTWYYSFQYSRAPPIDPGTMTWTYPLFYAMILGMWIAMQIALYLLIMNRRSYGYGTV